MNENKFNVQTPDGFSLCAISCFPVGMRRIVLMCHGISSHKQEYLDMFPILAHQLADLGIGSIRFDFRGHGESSGSSLDFDVMTQLIDIDSIINWISSSKELQELPLSFVGVSFGSAPGLLYQYSRVKFSRISLFAPVISFRETFVSPTTEWGKRNFNKKAWEAAQKTGYLLLDEEFQVSLRLLNNFLIIEPIEYFSKLQLPIQVFHGTYDNLVPCFVAQNLVNEHSNIEVNIIDKMGHGLYIDGDDEGLSIQSRKIQQNYFQAVANFLNE
jgi:uncharacterized protein